MTETEAQSDPDDRELMPFIERLTQATEAEIAEWSEMGSGYKLAWDNYSLVLSRDADGDEYGRGEDFIVLELRRHDRSTIREDRFWESEGDIFAAAARLLDVVARKVSKIEVALASLNAKLDAGEKFGRSEFPVDTSDFVPVGSVSAADDDIPF